jgi:Na+-driven multidrug efflux pump
MKNLTEGNIYKNFLFFAIPMILSSVISQASSTINTIIAGAYLQEEGLAATGATSALNNLINGLFWGYNMGFGAYIAKLFGAGKHSQLKSTMYNNLLLVSSAVIAISVLLTIFRYPLYNFLNVEPEILADSDRYFTIINAGRVFQLLNSGYVCVLTAMGGSMFPFMVSLVFAVLGIGGNILSVTVLEMGVAGIAATSVLSSALATLVYHLRFSANLRKLGVHKEKIKICLGDLRETFGYSLPVSAQQGLLYFIGLLLSSVINSLGVAATAGYVIVEKVYNLSGSLFTNASKTLSNYAAQAAGAGKYKEIRKGLKVGALQSLVLTLPMLAVTVIFAEPVCKMFLSKSTGAESLSYAILFARYYAPFILVYMFCNLIHSFYRGLAAVKSLLICSIFGSVVRLVASVLLAEFMGMEGIFLGWVISWFADLGLCLDLYLKKYRTPELLRQNIRAVASTK